MSYVAPWGHMTQIIVFGGWDVFMIDVGIYNVRYSFSRSTCIMVDVGMWNAKYSRFLRSGRAWHFNRNASIHETPLFRSEVQSRPVEILLSYRPAILKYLLRPPSPPVTHKKQPSCLNLQDVNTINHPLILQVIRYIDLRDSETPSS